ncbi:MAG TPA: ATP-binding cassette domain-containing protein, partial [Candidatus Obscuribacterales bacterium]
MRLQHVDLAASVGSHYLLQNISFEMFSGDRIALVGPSGAGKTSLLRLLNRLSEPTQGTIYFDQQEIRQIPVIQLRRQVVLVPQESKLLGMTVEAALTYPLTLQDLPRATITQRLQ